MTERGRVMRRCGRCGQRHPLGADCPYAPREPWGRKRQPGRPHDDPEYRRNRPLALERDGHRCTAVVAGERCGATAEGGAELEVDHIVPVAEGGGHALENLATLCRPHHDLKLQADRARQRAARRPGGAGPGSIS